MSKVTVCFFKKNTPSGVTLVILLLMKLLHYFIAAGKYVKTEMKDGGVAVVALDSPEKVTLVYYLLRF